MEKFHYSHKDINQGSETFSLSPIYDMRSKQLKLAVHNAKWKSPVIHSFVGKGSSFETQMCRIGAIDYKISPRFDSLEKIILEIEPTIKRYSRIGIQKQSFTCERYL